MTTRSVPTEWIEALVRYNDNARSFFQIANRIATELGTHALQTNFGAFAETTERMLKETHTLTNDARAMLTPGYDTPMTKRIDEQLDDILKINPDGHCDGCQTHKQCATHMRCLSHTEKFREAQDYAAPHSAPPRASVQAEQSAGSAGAAPETKQEMLQKRLGQFQFCIDRVAEALGNVCCGGIDSSPKDQMADPHSTTRVLLDAIERLKERGIYAGDALRVKLLAVDGMNKIAAMWPCSPGTVERIRNETLDRIDGPIVDTDHPEAFCQDCHRPNAVWFAPNEIWNSVNAEGNGILCPVCFIRKAEAAGIKGPWRIQPEFYGDLGDCDGDLES